MSDEGWTMSDERTWDVSPMVDNASVEEVKKMIETAVADAQHFANTSKGRIPTADVPTLRDILVEYEKHLVRTQDLTTYCSLRYLACTTDKDNAKLNNWGQKAKGEVMAAFIPLDIKIGQRVLDEPGLIDVPELSSYRHFLEQLKREAPYRLLATVESMISLKDTYGIKMMAQLQESWVSAKTFEVEVRGEKKTLPLPALSALRMDPEREVREMASRTLYGSYAKDDMLHGFALRSICADHVSLTQKRNMPSAMEQSLIDQDVDRETIDALLSTIEQTSGKYRDFLRTKARYMGMDRLLGYDIIAPWKEDLVWEFDWPSARTHVIGSFTSFDEELGRVIEEMFKDNRIDSAVRAGKANTAFCAGWPSGEKSFVLLTFNDTVNDLYTLAHENGHAAQGHLIYKHQNPINYGLSSCVAETGSIFGELLLTDRLLNMSDTDEQRLEILSTVLGNFYYTVYYVGCRALFEQTLYEHIEKGELLDAESACALWNAAKKRIFGDAVDWTEYMEYEWARIPHFFFPNRRFYNYSYSFAQMLVFALYEAYQDGGEDFVGRFKTLLGTGGSKSPHEQIAEFGFDITDPGFWDLGSKNAERLLDELKKLV